MIGVYDYTVIATYLSLLLSSGRFFMRLFARPQLTARAVRAMMDGIHPLQLPS